MKKKLTVLTILMLALAVALAGCGGGSSDDGEPGGSAGEPKEQEEKVLIFARGGDSVSMDYASITDGESSRVTIQIFETLLDFDRDSFEIKPGLAKDFDVSDDGMVYTFYLREGVKFHDGTDFNADAVIFNYERWADPDHPYHMADKGFVYNAYGNQFGGFKGDENHAIEAINKIDEHTVEFVLNRPLAAFVQNVAMTYFAITSPTSFEKYGERIVDNPVGTGPFVFEEWRRNDTITLSKNENYWKEGYPKLDRLIFMVIPDNSARLTALRAGDIDIMDGLSPDDIPVVEDNPNLTLFERAPNNIGYLGFQVEKEPFDNPLVRRAMNHLVDKEGLIKALYNDLAVPAKNPLPPGYLGYNDDIQAYEFDIEKGKQLLAEAGYPDGFEFDLWTMPVARPYMPDPARAAEALQADFAKAGLTANIVTMEWATYLAETEKGSQELYMLGWSGINGDPDYFLSNLLSKESIPTGNRSFWANDEVSDMFRRAQTISDFDERAAVYKEALEIVHEEAPWIPLVHSIPVVAGRDNVLNYVPHPSVSESLKYVDLK